MKKHLLLTLFTALILMFQPQLLYSGASGFQLRDLPPGWDFTPTGTSHIVAVTTTVTLNCITLTEGDYIGVFYTDDQGELACGGAIVWNPNQSQVLAAYGDDITTVGVKDGFAEAEAFTWKIYFAQSGTEQNVLVSYNLAMPHFNGLFYSNGISALVSMLNPLELTASADPELTCAGDPVQLSASVTGGCGTPIFSWTSDPAGFTSALQNPLGYPLTTTTYFVHVTNAFGDSQTASVVIEVNPLPVFDCPEFGPFCEGDDAVVFNGAGVYTFGGEVVYGFDPAVVGEYLFVYTETSAFGCEANCEFVILVNPLPVFDCPAYEPLCEGDEVVVFDGPGVYTFDGEVVESFDPILAGEYFFIYTETTLAGCESHCEFSILVNSPPEFECPAYGPFCEEDEAIFFEGRGVYTSGGVVVEGFDPAVAGEYFFVYTETNEFGCSASCEFSIVVNPLPVFDCPEFGPFCAGDDPVAFEGNGVFTYGGDVVEGFDPAAAGEYFFVYTETNEFDCSASCEFSIVVNPLPVFDCPEFGPFCAGDDPVAFEGNGVFTYGGDVVEGFDPAVAGEYFFVYTETNEFGCSASCEFSIVVNPLPVFDCPEFGPFCAGDDPVAFEGIGVFTSGGVMVEGFDPAVAGEYFFVYTETNGFGCSASCEFSIVVNPLPVFECPAFGPFCEGDDPVAFEGNGVFTFGGDVVTGFDPTVAGEYFFVYTETNEFGCSASCEFSIVVKELPQLNCPENFEICLNSPNVPLDMANPQGGIYSGEGVLYENGNYYFETFLGVGTYLITYCYVDQDTGCENCCDFLINVVADHLIDIPAGWSGISSFITPYDSQLSNLLYPITYPLIILSNFEGVFWPGGNTFTLENWNEYTGHVIKSEWETQLPVCGEEVMNKTVNLIQGWNLLPILSPESIEIVDLFTGVSGFQIAKEVASTGAYWPEFGINTIGDVEPGKSYYVRMTTPGSVDFSTLSKSGSSNIQIDINQLSTPWNKVVQTPGSHLAAFNLNESQLLAGDIVGGITPEGICAGLTEVTDTKSPFAVTLNPDDTFLSEKSGFESGEPINFKIYRPSTGEIFEVEANYNPALNQGVFEHHGLSEINTLKLSATSVNEAEAQSISIYPNPTSGSLTISGLNSMALVTVLNGYGAELFSKKLNLPETIDISELPKGVYLIRIETLNELLFKKIVLK